MANTPTLIAFSIYLAAMLVLGWLGYRTTKNLSDYILGGRSLNSFITALAAGASDMSGWLMMGLPGAVYLRGLSESWIAIGLTLGAWTNWRYVAARLRLYTEKCGNALTLPEYFSNRFEDKSNLLRIVTALAILIFFSVYCASGIVASTRLFQNLLGMSYDTALWVGAITTISYVFIGGFLAVSWTDTVQATLMVGALFITPVMIIFNNGGIKPTFDAIEILGISRLNMFEGLSAVSIISLLAWGLGYYGQPHILARFMAAKSVQVIPAARRISMSWMMVCLAGAVLIGFLGSAYFTTRAELATKVNQNPEVIFMELTELLFNPWIGGIIFAGILSAVMSTLSAQLLVCSSALTEDIYRALCRKQASQNELVWVGRLMVLLVSLFAISLANHPDSQVLGMVGYAWAGFGAAFGPVVILSLIWPRMTRSGALAGIIVGALIVIIWKQYAWFGLYEIIPGFILACVAIFITSLLSPPPSKTIYATFNQVNQELLDNSL